MKNWFLFAGHHYYPSGGMGDFIKAFSTDDEAEEFVVSRKLEGNWNYGWYDIVDITSEKYQSEDYLRDW